VDPVPRQDAKQPKQLNHKAPQAASSETKQMVDGARYDASEKRLPEE